MKRIKLLESSNYTGSIFFYVDRSGAVCIFLWLVLKRGKVTGKKNSEDDRVQC